MNHKDKTLSFFQHNMNRYDRKTFDSEDEPKFNTMRMQKREGFLCMNKHF